MSLPVTAIPTASVKKEVETGTVFLFFFKGEPGWWFQSDNLHQEVKHQSFSPRRFGFHGPI